MYFRNHKTMTNANAPNDSESNTYKGSYYGITMRPNENYLFFCNHKRYKYGVYCERDQKTILQGLIDNARAKGLIFTDIFYEQTALYGERSSLHFHAVLKFDEKATYDALTKFADDCNKKYKGSYIQFDFKRLETSEDQANWASYIRKDIKHSECAWTKGI